MQVKRAWFFVLILFSAGIMAQNDPAGKNAFMQQDIQMAFDFWNITQPSTEFHSSFKPYLSSTFSKANDSLVPFKIYSFKNTYLQKAVFEKAHSHNHYAFQFHPILDFEAGYDALRQRAIRATTGGLHVKAFINNNFTFALSLFGGNNQYAFFLDTTIARQNIIPEVGQAYGNSNSGYNFFDYTGYLSYSPGRQKVFNFQLGRDKHFIGDGYRSVLYSDFSAPSSYFGVNVNVWRLQYNVWYAWMNDVTSANGIKSNFKPKYGTFHYLSYNIIKQIQIGFFENVVWRGSDTNQVRTFEVNYLNPVIFLRPQEYSVGSPDNSFIGFNINFTLFKTLKIYGQLGLDEFYFKELKANTGWWANKQAWQAGFKYVNAFKIKGLKLQAEYNQARPYTYSHGLVEQNYSHYGAALAHPLGANFKETLLFVNYRRNRWEIGWQGMYAIIGKDYQSANSNVGQNIFLSYNTRNNEYGNYTTQGVLTNVLQSTLKCTYFLIPDLNMRIELGYIQRSEKNTSNYLLENPYVFVGFKTSFWNCYKDY